MSAEQAPAPDHFASFFEARQYILERTGRAFKGTDPDLLAEAEKLGVRPAVEAILGRYKALEGAAGARAIELLQERADTRPPPSNEPPLVEFPDEWKTKKPGADALPGYPISDVWNGYETPKYLVKRVLAPSELTVIFGMSQHFKSVVAIDMALCVGLGLEYQGLKARKGGVLYVAGEGHAGIKKRARAWMLDRGMDSASEQPAMFVTSTGADLIGKPEQMRATVAEAAKIVGCEIELVVIDTLAANFGDGDENHASDMQLAINGARQAAPKAAVLLVHHVGNGQHERERGSYALQASADCRLQSTYDSNTRTIELKWLKLKDDEMPEPITFTWRSIPLEWTDDDGEEMTSVVLDRLEMDGQTQPKQEPKKAPAYPRPVGLGKNQELALKLLKVLLARTRKNLRERGEDPTKACILTAGWRAALDEKGVPRNRINDLSRDLQERGILVFDGPHVAFANEMLASALASGSGHESRPEHRPEHRPEPDAIPVAKTDRFTPDRLVLRTTPAVTEPTGTQSPESNDATGQPDDRTARAGPLAGPAPSQHPEPGSDNASGPAEPMPKANPPKSIADTFDDFE